MRHATGKGKTVVLLGFTDPDLDHLTANQPISLDPKQLGLPDCLIELPLAGPGIQEGTLALLFYARDDEGLLALFRKAGLLSPSTRVTSDKP